MGVFTFRAAGEITFGVGAIERLGTAIKKSGGKRILVVVDRGFAKTGAFQKVTQNLGLFWSEHLSSKIFNILPKVTGRSEFFIYSTG